MPDLFTLTIDLFLLDLLLDFVILVPSQSSSPLPSKPASCQSLDEQSSLISPLQPHIRIEVWISPHRFVGAHINEEPLFLHLAANLPLDLGGLGDPLISLCLSGEA